MTLLVKVSFFLLLALSSKVSTALNLEFGLLVDSGLLALLW